MTGVPSQRIVRQDVTFVMMLPEAGDPRMSTTLTVTTTGGDAHTFTVDGVIRRALAGPVNVRVETILVVPTPFLRDRLAECLADSEAHGVEDRVDAVLELLSERPNLLEELERWDDNGD